MKWYLIPPSHLSKSIALGISQVRDVVSRGPGKAEAARGELHLAEPCLTLPQPPRAPGVPHEAPKDRLGAGWTRAVLGSWLSCCF